MKFHKLFIFLLIGMFLLSSVNALEFDNIKTERTTTFDGKSITGNTLLEMYKPIEIKNAFGLGEKLFEGYLSQHDNTCGQNCESTIEIKLANKGSLVDDVYFETILEDESRIRQDIRSYQFSYIGTIKDYERQCVQGAYNSKNDSYAQECSNIEVGSHQGKINYNLGDEVNAGIYTLTLDAQKRPSRSVDWVIKTNGEWLKSWATWGNISLGDDAEVILNSPTDASTAYDFLQTFNASANITGGATLTNMSLWTNETGSWELRNTSSSQNIPTEINTGSSYSVAGTESGYTGVAINISGVNLTLNSFTRNTLSGVSGTGYIGTTPLGNDVATCTWIGDTCTPASPVILLANTNYFITGAGGDFSWEGSTTFVQPTGGEFAWYGRVDQVGGIYPNSVATIESINVNILTNLTNSTQTWNRTITDDIIWNVQACDTDGDCGWATSNYSLIMDTTAPTVNIISPNGTYDYGYTGENTTLNYSVVDSNLDSCWYDYNGTNITTPCTSGATNVSYFILANSDTNLTFYANDSVGNLLTETINWSYTYFENNRSLNTTTYETASETFQINIDGASTVDLDYNGTEYRMSKSGTQFIYTLDVPSNLGNNTIYFEIDDTTNTYNSYQNVSEIVFTQCNSTYNTIFLNLSFKDESNLSAIDASIPTSTFEYYLGSGDVTKSYQYINNTDNTNYTFCASPNLTMYINPYVQYKQGTTYPQRIWDPEAIAYTSTTTNQILYLLNSINGIYVTFQVINSVEQAISDVLITAVREISGSDVTVATGLTSSAGAATFWLNPDFSHDFTFSKTGFTTYESSFAPTQSAYTVQMGSTTTANITISNFKGITYNIYPENTSLINDTTYSFQFNVSSSFWDVSEYGFNLVLPNGTIVDTESTNTIETLLSSDYNTGNISYITMNYYWLINDTYTNKTQRWVIYNTEYSGYSISHLFTRIHTYMDQEPFGLDDFARYLITFLIILISVGVMSYKYGLTSPLAVVFMIFLIIFFLDVVLGFIPDITLLNGTTVPNILTVITGIVFIIFIMREATR